MAEKNYSSLSTQSRTSPNNPQQQFQSYPKLSLEHYQDTGETESQLRLQFQLAASNQPRILENLKLKSRQNLKFSQELSREFRKRRKNVMKRNLRMIKM